MLEDIFVASFVLIVSIITVGTFILILWYCVWKLFLSRIRFIRELTQGQSQTNLKRSGFDSAKVHNQ